jgi:hypothetical protein
MSLNPYQSPDSPGQPPPKSGKPRFTLLHVLGALAAVGVLAALFLPAPRMAREAGRRSQCGNNLKQIAIALHNYHDKCGAFPPAYTVDADGKPLHSWRTLILPYLEQKPLYDKIDLTKPWDDPANKEAFDTRVPTYRCPSNDTAEGHTIYLAVVAPGSCLQPTQSRTLEEVKDQPTLMIVEVDADHAVHWMSPMDASEELLLQLGTAKKPPHPGGFQAAMTDGSVRMIDAKTKPATLRAAISIAGGEVETLD